MTGLRPVLRGRASQPQPRNHIGLCASTKIPRREDVDSAMLFRIQVSESGSMPLSERGACLRGSTSL